MRANFYLPNEIIASQPIEELREKLQSETAIRVVRGNEEVVRRSEIVFLGVKPSVVLPVISEAASGLRGKLVVSLAAGTLLQSMEAIAEARFLRVMTNTPAAIGRAATAFARGTCTTSTDVAAITEIFRAIGLVVEVEEKQIDAVTALAGSGPAFVYSAIEAMAAGGAKVGLPNESALALAIQTFLGAAQLASESDSSPEALRRAVVTPGGTTAAGLAAMDKLKFADGLVAAVEAATARGREMAREASR